MVVAGGTDREVENVAFGAASVVETDHVEDAAGALVAVEENGADSERASVAGVDTAEAGLWVADVENEDVDDEELVAVEEGLIVDAAAVVVNDDCKEGKTSS